MSASPDPNKGRSSLYKRLLGTLRAFWKDVKTNIWKELAKNTARAILLIIGILLGGYFVVDRLQEYQEKQNTTKTYCFRGCVRDFYTDERLADVKVAIANVQKGGWGQTNPAGKFILCVDLPEDQKTVEITFIRLGYKTERYKSEAVPQDRESEQYYKDYLLFPEEDDQPEMLN